MAFPVVEGTATSVESAGTTSHTVDLPASVAAGDLLIVMFAAQSNGSITWPGSWAEIVNVSPDADNRYAVAWLKATGGESSITVTTGDTVRSAHNAYRISTMVDPVTQAPEGGGASGSGAPDSPNLTPTGGAKDYLWLAGMGGFNGGADPTSYTDGINISTTNLDCKSARRELNAASENPGTRSGGTGAWGAATIAIHPLAVAALASQRLKIGHGR